MTSVLEWGGGCSCCGRETKAELRAQCKNKGRRLPEAHSFALGVLHDAMTQAGAWGPEMFGGDAELVRQTQAVIRGSWLAAKEKLAFLDRLPYLLCRLNEPGVRDRVLSQWDSGAKTFGCPITEEFVGESSPLRGDVLAMQNDGTGMTSRLAEEVNALRQTTIDDTPGDSPHAKMKTSRCGHAPRPGHTKRRPTA